MTFNSWYNLKKSNESGQCYLNFILISSISKNIFFSLPEAPVMSIFLRFLHSRIPTVSFPDVGTYLREKQISPKYYMKLCERERERKKIKERRKLCKFICKEWPKAKIFGQSKRFLVVVLIWGPVLFYRKLKSKGAI